MAAVFAVALIVPAVASAHATMKQSTPAEQGRVETPPTEVTLRFDQSVVAPPDGIVVLAADGRKVSGAVTQSNGGTVVRARVAGLVAGEAYTVRWREVSADGHVGTGVFTFGVAVDPPPPTEAVGSSGMTWRDDVARWALFASLALMIGVVGIRLLVLPRVVDQRVERRVYLLGTLGAVLAVNAGIVGFVIRSANALQVSEVDLLYADLSPFAESTRFGTAFLVTTLGFGICLTILVVAWALDRPVLRWPAFLLALALVWGYPLSGHQATEPNSSLLGEVADWVHLVTAMLWVGGVLTLAVVVWPLAPDLRRAAFLRFSRIAVFLIGVLVIAGTVVAIERLPELSDLWTTSYGRTLLVKIGLVLVALAWGGFHHTFVRPRLERGESPPGWWGGACWARASSRWRCSSPQRCSSTARRLPSRRAGRARCPAQPRRAGHRHPPERRVVDALTVAERGRRSSRALAFRASCSSRSPAAQAFSACISPGASSPTVTTCGSSTSHRSTTPGSRAASTSSGVTSGSRRMRAGSRTAPTCSSTPRQRSRSRRAAPRSGR